jgi:two-component system phosphate regulon response regulator PhoB
MSPSKKIMLVEDDKNMRSVLRTLLEIEGYQVVIHPLDQPLDGILSSVHDSRPDVILLDYHLTDFSGLEVLKSLRADPDVKHTRVIMSSGSDVQDRCLAAGADDFLLKPYMPDELIRKLNK